MLLYVVCRPLHKVAEPVIAETTGVVFTVTFLLADVVPQKPPLVVSVKVTVPGADAEAVYNALAGLLFVNEPALPPDKPSDQVPPVAPPPTEPPRARVVLPWHKFATAGPALTVGN